VLPRKPTPTLRHWSRQGPAKRPAETIRRRCAQAVKLIVETVEAESLGYFPLFPFGARVQAAELQLRHELPGIGHTIE